MQSADRRSTIDIRVRPSTDRGRPRSSQPHPPAPWSHSAARALTTCTAYEYTRFTLSPRPTYSLISPIKGRTRRLLSIHIQGRTRIARLLGQERTASERVRFSNPRWCGFSVQVRSMPIPNAVNASRHQCKENMLLEKNSIISVRRRGGVALDIEFEQPPRAGLRRSVCKSWALVWADIRQAAVFLLLRMHCKGDPTEGARVYVRGGGGVASLCCEPTRRADRCWEWRRQAGLQCFVPHLERRNTGRTIRWRDSVFGQLSAMFRSGRRWRRSWSGSVRPSVWCSPASSRGPIRHGSPSHKVSASPSPLPSARPLATRD